MYEIVFIHVNPQIPVRNFDWSANVSGQEGRATGWGPTQLVALLDLAEKLVEAEAGAFHPFELPK